MDNLPYFLLMNEVLKASVQFSITEIAAITLESYSIFHYGVLSQADEICSLIICDKERRREKNL